MQETITALDLGTNTFRWVSAALNRETGELTEIDRGRESVGIGRSLAETAAFGPAEIEAARQTLTAWTPGGGIIPQSGKILGTATHAFRAASNGRAVAASLSQQSQIPIRIVSPQTEAALTFRGCTDQRTPADEQLVCVLDIGGGSTELSWGSAGLLRDSISLPVGVVTLAAADEEVLTRSVARAAKAVDSALSEVYNDSPSTMFRSLDHTTVISTCGTSSALTLEYQDLAAYERRLLDGQTVPFDWLQTLINARKDWKPAHWETLQNGAARSRLMGPGIGILQTFLAMLGASEWQNSEAGLLEGALAELGADTTWIDDADTGQ